MKSQTAICICAISLLVSNADLAEAATITRINNPNCHISLQGEIESGDSKQFLSAFEAARVEIQRRVSQALKENREDTGQIETVAMCLNSPGGDYPEALAIVKLMLDAGGVATVIDENAKCHSACALIFMFGYDEGYHDDKFFDRRLHVRGELGFHAPYIEPDPANYGSQTVANSFRAGIQAFGNLLELDRNEFLARGLVVEFMKVGPQDTLLVDNIDRSGEWTIELFGFRSPEKLMTNHVVTACDNEEEWQERRKTREFNISRFVEKRPPKNQPLQFKASRAMLILQGYGDEGGGFCIGRLQRQENGNVALEISIEFDEEKIKEMRKDTQFDILGGRPLVSPGFGRQKPMWFMYPRGTKIVDIAAKK